MRRTLMLLLIGAVLVPAALTAYFWDGSPPELEWLSQEQVGPGATLLLAFSDQGKGLASAELVVRQGGEEKGRRSVEFAGISFPWETGNAREEISLSLAQEVPSGLKDGQFEVEVTVKDQPNLWFFSRTTLEARTFNLDSRPPQITVVTIQHYLNQGGAETVLYRLSETGCRSGVVVGEQLFEGYPVSEGTYMAIFALAYDQPSDPQIRVWAEDPAGNRSEVGIWCKIFPKQFRSRRIDISDSFISKVVPGIAAEVGNEYVGQSDLETFLNLNSRLRVDNNQKIADVSRRSQPRLLWTEPFIQLSNSQVESLFADRRSYHYEGKKVDEQTHLGFDLASLMRSPVEAANRGVVAYADYLGIYGNTVMVDHGLGLFSLYAHLSSFEVEAGQQVERGQSLGRTGETGLAGGDHLHFSMVVQGVQVTPVEWWDPGWVKIRFFDRIKAN